MSRLTSAPAASRDSAPSLDAAVKPSSPGLAEAPRGAAPEGGVLVMGDRDEVRHLLTDPNVEHRSEKLKDMQEAMGLSDGKFRELMGDILKKEGGIQTMVSAVTEDSGLSRAEKINKLSALIKEQKGQIESMFANGILGFWQNDDLIQALGKARDGLQQEESREQAEAKRAEALAAAEAKRAAAEQAKAEAAARAEAERQAEAERAAAEATRSEELREAVRSVLTDLNTEDRAEELKRLQGELKLSNSEFRAMMEEMLEEEGGIETMVSGVTEDESLSRAEKIAKLNELIAEQNGSIDQTFKTDLGLYWENNDLVSALEKARDGLQDEVKQTRKDMLSILSDDRRPIEDRIDEVRSLQRDRDLSEAEVREVAETVVKALDRRDGRQDSRNASKLADEFGLP